MILGEAETLSNSDARTTLDDLFRRTAWRRPHALALADPPNRNSITGDAPRRLTYAQTDAMVSAIAARFLALDLPADTIVGIQLPNMVESILTFLGVSRAGMIAAPLPLLWRQAECVAALTRLGAKVLVTCGRVGASDHGELARNVASETFAIRHVFGYGRDLPEGIIPLDDLFNAANPAPPPIERDGDPAAHVAVITWDVTAEGLIPVARNHMELTAAGLAVVLESAAPPDGVILSALPPDFFSGIALTTMTWLLTGGTLVLHHPFAPDIFAAQCRDHGCGIAIMPGAVAQRLANAGMIDGPRTVLAAWRAPERLSGSAPWRSDIALIDVLVLGEIGLVAARRDPDGTPPAIRPGVITAPQGNTAGVPVIEIMRGNAGTIALRGPMTPHHPYPFQAERGTAPYLKIPATGFIDTGFTCRIDPEARGIVVTGPPAGIVSVGGYRFRLRETQDLIAKLQADATLAALPDALAGHRLAGSAQNRNRMRKTLEEKGVNPLVALAFRDRNTAA